MAVLIPLSIRRHKTSRGVFGVLIRVLRHRKSLASVGFSIDPSLPVGLHRDKAKCTLVLWLTGPSPPRDETIFWLGSARRSTEFGRGMRIYVPTSISKEIRFKPGPWWGQLISASEWPLRKDARGHLLEIPLVGLPRALWKSSRKKST